MAAVILTGIPGSGKTTVLTKAMELLGGEADTIEHVVYGTKMFDIAKQRGLVSDRDEMRRLPVETQTEIQVAAAKSIGNKAQKSSLVVDTHCTVKTPNGFIPGLPAHVLDLIKPIMIVLVETDPAEIVARRDSDTSRSRDEETESELNLHQDINRAYAASYSLLTNAPVKVVENKQGLLEEAARQLAEVLRWISS